MIFSVSCLLSMRLRHVVLMATLLAVAFFTDCSSIQEDEEGGVVTRAPTSTTTEAPEEFFGNLCIEDKNTFAEMIQIMGVYNGQLYAITADYHWGVYELSQCTKHHPRRCMTVSEPVKLKDKWPEFAQTIKQAIGRGHRTNFDFKHTPINDVVFIKSPDSADDDLALFRGYFGHGLPQQDATPYLAFNLDEKIKKNMHSDMEILQFPGTWISSDLGNKGFRLFSRGTHLGEFDVRWKRFGWQQTDSLFVAPVKNSRKVFCDQTLGDPQDNWLELVDQDKNSCERQMTWTLEKGVFFQHYFYFFSKDQVHYFSEDALRRRTVYMSSSFENFFHCESNYTTTTTTTPAPTEDPGDTGDRTKGFWQELVDLLVSGIKAISSDPNGDDNPDL